MLKVNNVSVSYGNLKVLHDVSLYVEKNEIVLTIGPNAAGKTTLLRAIMGIIHPSKGEIIFRDQNIGKLPTHEIVELGISLIPEGRHLFPHLLVEENLELGAYTKRARKKKEDMKEWVYSLFPILKERRKQKAGTLSGGEQQMLAIGRGLMSCPDLFLVDEPSSGLAPKLLPILFKALTDINKNGIAVLFTEQNVWQSLRIANKAYLLENGRIVLSGDVSNLLNNNHIKNAYLGIEKK